jgi:cytochrome oxidase Cu insertion factor (SCO1/SenC/PrrC family)
VEHLNFLSGVLYIEEYHLRGTWKSGARWTSRLSIFRHYGERHADKCKQVYFGFTHCPDICPDELDKMALMYDKVTEKCGDVLVPIMITCDPARDSPAVLKEYLKEFHPQIIGLTGDYENIKQTCKVYRVYFSTPSSVKPGQDYLVDHSIYFYLMGRCLPIPSILPILQSMNLSLDLIARL